MTGTPHPRPMANWPPPTPWGPRRGRRWGALSRARERGGRPDQGARAALEFLRQGLQLARAPRALRWRLETFGLYMPSLPEARPWWRVNGCVLALFLTQLPRYARWLVAMRALRREGASGYWRRASGTGLSEWEDWLNLSDEWRVASGE